MTEFRASVRERDGTAVVELHGDVNADADLALQGAFQQALAGGASRVLLRFDDVEYINSTGIALIVGLLAQARSRATPVLVCGLSDHFRHIFEITRLSDFMSFYPDEDAAVRDLAAPTS